MARGTSQTNKTGASVRDALLKTASNIPSASAIVDQSFEEDTNIQQTFSERITARTKSAMPNALRAESAFKDFRPSQFTKRELEPRRYLAPGENLATALTGIVKNGVDRIRSETNRQGL